MNETEYFKCTYEMRLSRGHVEIVSVGFPEMKNTGKTRKRRKSKFFFNGVWCRRSFPVSSVFIHIKYIYIT